MAPVVSTTSSFGDDDDGEDDEGAGVVADERMTSAVARPRRGLFHLALRQLMIINARLLATALPEEETEEEEEEVRETPGIRRTFADAIGAFSRERPAESGGRDERRVLVAWVSSH